MNIFIKTLLLASLFLMACTDKKAQNTSETVGSAAISEEIQAIESISQEYEETTKSIEEKAKELDDLLGEIDN